MSASKSSSSSKRSHLRQHTAVTASTSGAADPTPPPGNCNIKPPPDVKWKKQAIASIQKYTVIPIIDRTSTPDCINSQTCPEIHPHVLDRVTGDGHCGFRALSKSITGTESNHAAFRAAVVAFMRSSCAGRRRPWLVNARSIDAYISQTLMDTTGWMTDVELQFVTSLLQITIYVFATVNQRAHESRWISYSPAFRTQECMAATTDSQLHLHHNRARDHFDRVVYKE